MIRRYKRNFTICRLLFFPALQPALGNFARLLADNPKMPTRKFITVSDYCLEQVCHAVRTIQFANLGVSQSCRIGPRGPSRCGNRRPTFEELEAGALWVIGVSAPAVRGCEDAGAGPGPEVTV
jgi:hypothetical protein